MPVSNVIIPPDPEAEPHVKVELGPTTGVVVIMRFKEGESRRWGRTMLLPATENIGPEQLPAIANQFTWNMVRTERPIRAFECFHAGLCFVAFRWDSDSEIVCSPVFDLQEGEIRYVFLDPN